MEVQVPSLPKKVKYDPEMDLAYYIKKKKSYTCFLFLNKVYSGKENTG